jgi:hypothetical protein
LELFKAPLIIVGKQNYTDFMICANLHSKYLLSSNKSQTYALFLHRFFVSLQQTNSKSYGKEPFKQVCLAGGNHQ